MYINVREHACNDPFLCTFVLSVKFAYNLYTRLICKHTIERNISKANKISLKSFEKLTQMESGSFGKFPVVHDKLNKRDVASWIWIDTCTSCT